MFHEPPPMHPNQIDAAYIDFRNRGQFYLPRLSTGPVHIDDWRKEMLEKWEKRSAASPLPSHQETK